jgi:glutathione-specific gamma-glutamylcyclotransferase
MPAFHPNAENCRWLFAYGSLMWRPGFEFEQAVSARLSGYHRRLSVFSNHYRGTHEKPGLVFGLDRGGSCIGLGYCVRDENWPHVLAYIREREMITDVYKEIVKKIYVSDQSAPVLAVTYAVNRWHPQCAPAMPLLETMNYVNQGVGLAGTCVSYVANTVQHLRDMGVKDAALEKLAPYLKSQAARAQEVGDEGEDVKASLEP